MSTRRGGIERTMKDNHRGTEAQRMKGLRAFGAHRVFLCVTSVSLCLCG